MHDLTPFERRLTERLAVELGGSVRPFDPAMVAATAIGRRQPVDRRSLVLLVAATAVLITLIGGAIAAGWRPVDDSPSTSALPWPLVGVVEATGSLHSGDLVGAPVVLADGRVLVLTRPDPDDVSVAEVWDPATGVFELQPPMERAIEPYTATVLRDGRVLFLGLGMTQIGGETTAEIFDPATGTFSLLASRPHTIDGAAVLLRDGRVLITGGRENLEQDELGFQGITTTAEIFDPLTEQFTEVVPMQRRRTWHDMELLRDGRVLVLGGEYDEGTQVDQPVAEIFDPRTGRFELAPRPDYLTMVSDWHVRRGDRDLVFLRQPGWGRYPDRSLPMTISYYDLETGVETAGPTIAASAPVFDVREPIVLADNRLLVYGSDKASFVMSDLIGMRSDGWVGVLDLETGQLRMLATRAGGVAAVVPLRDGGLMLLGGSRQVECDFEGATRPCFAALTDVDIIR